MRVLLTRPLREAKRSAEKLITLGFTPLIAPVFEEVKLLPMLPKAEAIIVTSPRALHVLGGNDLPVFRLETTGEALALQIKHSNLTHFLWLTSKNRAFDLVSALPDKKIDLIYAYEMRKLSPDLSSLKLDVALHYSKEAAEHTLHLLEDNAYISHYALSKRIACVIPPYLGCKIASEPNETALFSLLKEATCLKRP